MTEIGPLRRGPDLSTQTSRIDHGLRRVTRILVPHTRRDMGEDTGHRLEHERCCEHVLQTEPKSGGDAWFPDVFKSAHWTYEKPIRTSP